MGNSVRVETYLPVDTVRELDRVTDNRSEFIRDLVEDELRNSNEVSADD